VAIKFKPIKIKTNDGCESDKGIWKIYVGHCKPLYASGGVHVNRANPAKTFKNIIQVSLSWFSGTPYTGRRSDQVTNRQQPPVSPLQGFKPAPSDLP
jgi:hypothetical protein